MSILSDKIATLRADIDTYLQSKNITSFNYGLVRFASKKEFSRLETINYDEKGQMVTFDDRYDSSFYLKCKSENFKQERSSGKSTLYAIDSDITMYVMAKSDNIKDYLTAFLTKYSNIEISDIDNDSQGIAKSELAGHSYDIQQYLFSISFKLKYRSNECYFNACD